MRRSNQSIKTRKEVPAEEVSKNAQLLMRAGYIHKEMAGAYVLLPLGLRVVEKIKQIVREEMDATGAEELLMTSLQRKELWERTDRWNSDNVDVWFKSQLQSGKEVGFGWSHEEPISDMIRGFISSYRDLPVKVYQFQTKLRNELRAKSGIMRGREFLMKDLYSFSLNEEEHQKYYEQVTQSYLKIFKRLGIGKETFLTFASGGAFTQFSHEFQTITEVGEDTIYVSKDKKIAVNAEVLSDEVLEQLGLNRDELEEVKAAEVGNIFSFGTTKSEELDLQFAAEDGSQQYVVLGSYGIGITRLVGVISELMSDDKGLVWPKAIAPYQVYLAHLGNDENTVSTASKLYDDLSAKGVDVIYDDRDTRPGEKFADSELMGIPLRVVVSERSLASGGVEVQERTAEDSTVIPVSDLLAKF